MIRTYPLKHFIHKSKQAKIRALLLEYRLLAQSIAQSQWKLFFQLGAFNKDADIKHLKTPLSERYKQTCQYQVVSTLNSFISNRANDFIPLVLNSSLNSAEKRSLLYLNKYALWFQKQVKMPKLDENGKHIEGEFIEIPAELLKLARVLFKEVMKWHKRPTFKHYNMALDAKVAKIN
ncbi:MAG: hypothetical protein AABZ60_14580, partial [Planctomycetota bacterium]